MSLRAQRGNPVSETHPSHHPVITPLQMPRPAVLLNVIASAARQSRCRNPTRAGNRPNCHCERSVAISSPQPNPSRCNPLGCLSHVRGNPAAEVAGFVADAPILWPAASGYSRSDATCQSAFGNHVVGAAWSNSISHVTLAPRTSLACHCRRRRNAVCPAIEITQYQEPALTC